MLAIFINNYFVKKFVEKVEAPVVLFSVYGFLWSFVIQYQLEFFILKIVSVQKFDCYSLETTRCCTLCHAKNTPTRSFVSNVYISQHSLPENAVKSWNL
jgi:hypothetical protein